MAAKTAGSKPRKGTPVKAAKPAGATAARSKRRPKAPAAGRRPAATPRRSGSRADRANQFTFMRAPGLDHAFQVGGTVEVFCDHEKGGERIRGWIRGIVVQVDSKMVAVQFRTNVFLTDGWMVPDRILWYPVHSEHIRGVESKTAVRRLIPEY